MEACGPAHRWARWLNSTGIEVRLLPAACIRAYVRRNKAACALANLPASAAVLRDHAAYGNPRPRPDKKLERTAFAIAA